MCRACLHEDEGSMTMFMLRYRHPLLKALQYVESSGHAHFELNAVDVCAHMQAAAILCCPLR